MERKYTKKEYTYKETWTTTISIIFTFSLHVLDFGHSLLTDGSTANCDVA